MNKSLRVLYVVLFIAGLAMAKLDGNADLLAIAIAMGIMELFN